MRYTELCPPKRLAVRRQEAEMMVGYAKIIDGWIKDGQLNAVNPGDPVPVYSTREIESLFEKWMIERRRTRPSQDAECQRQRARDARSGFRRSGDCPRATQQP